MTEDIEQERIKLTTANEYADYYRNELGLNVIPANTKEKTTALNTWEIFQHRPISLQVHDKWKNDNSFDQGIAMVMGKVSHHVYKKDLQFIGIDLEAIARSY
ncbi:MAG TPA: hypothetical protein VF884_10250 [Nitrososphaeraceae archaeon]